MFDDYDLSICCEEVYDEIPDWEEEYDDSLETGFDPYMGCYSWDC